MIKLLPHLTKNRDKKSRHTIFYIIFSEYYIFPKFLYKIERKNISGHASNLIITCLCFYFFKNDVFLFILFLFFKLIIHSFDYI